MNKVAIYCRLSDEDKDKNNKYDESESIQNQKTLLTKYSNEKGWSIYKIYSDDDYSGLDINRPDFNILIKEAKEGKFNIVLCKHQSRFSRDIEVVEKYLHRKFPEWGIRFISLTDHVDTLDETNKKSRQINSLVNEWYCEDISKAIRATFKVKREAGKFIGSFAPYGYVKDPENKNKLIIDEEAVRVIKMIFNWYLEGNGTQHIAYMLNEKGIPNPTKYKQKKGLKYKNSSQTDAFGLWNKTTIRRILRNEVYIGNTVQGKREKVNYKSKKMISKSKNDWIVVEDTHIPIIDINTYKEVQKRLSKKVRSTGLGKTHIFAGKVRCIDCKSSMNKAKAGNGYEYLRCKLYVRDPQKKLCTSHSIRLDVLEEIVTEKLRNHLNKIDDNKIALNLNKENDIFKEVKYLENQIFKIDKKIEVKDNVIKNLYIDKINGIISNEQFYDLNKRFSEDKDNLLKTKYILEEDMEKLSERIDSLDKWKEVADRYRNFNKLNHSIVTELIDYIEVGEKNKSNKEQKIKIHWNF